MATVDEYIISVRTKGDKKAKASLKGVGKAGKDMSLSLGSSLKSVAKLGGGFFAAQGLIKGLQNTIRLSGELQKVSLGFKNLSNEANFSADTFNKLNMALDGTVNEMDIMRQANNAMLLGIFETEDQMAEMFDIAQRLGSALGQDATFAVESLTTGLGRQSKLMLDNLGIMIDTNKAYEDFARANNLVASELDDGQRKQAFVNAAMLSARQLSASLGDETLTTADAISRMTASASNLGATLGNKVSPFIKLSANATADFLDGINAWMKKAPEWQRLMEQNKEELKDWSTESIIAAQVSEQDLSVKIKLVAFLQRQNELTSAQKILLQELTETGAVQLYQRLQEGLQFVHPELRAVNDELELQKVNISEVNDSMSHAIPMYEQFFASISTGAKFTEEAVEQMEMYVKSSIAMGRSINHLGKAAQAAATRYVTAQIQEAVAAYISTWLKTTPLPPWISAPLAVAGGAAFGSLMQQTIGQMSKIKLAATGMDEMVTKPTLILAGEAGPEHVNITPTGGGTTGGGNTFVFNNPITSEQWVESEFIDMLETAARRRGGIAVS